MEEKNYGINWMGLFIKVTVFVIVVLLAIWLISKITLKNKGISFDENNKLFTDATVEYFKDNLPKKDSSDVTLKKLIEKDYLKKLINDNGKTCDINKSISEITLMEDYYSIKSTLICGNKSKTTYIKLGNETCEDCDIKIEGLEIKQKEEDNNSEKVENKPQTNNNTNINNKPTQTILYEYVKEKVEYSDWYVGNVTGANIENSTKDVSYSKYCKMETHTYRTVSYSYVKELDHGLTNYCVGLGQNIIVQLFEYTFVFLIIGHPNYLVLGILAAFTTVIPYVGALIVDILALLIASVISTKLFVLTAIVLAVCPLLDGYVIGPKIYGKTNKLHPLVSIFAVFAGGILAGFWGIVLSLPVAIIIITTVKFFWPDINVRIEEIKKK